MQSKITIFTDGSSRGNPGPGGWGTIIIEEGEKNIIVKELGGREDHTTNNRMELRAAIEGLRNAKEHAEITLYTDSSYLINGITKWVKQWKRNGWVTRVKEEVLNRDLWEQLDESVGNRSVKWKYVGGHVGIPGNERCDEIATSYADNAKIDLFYGNIKDYNIPNILNIDETQLKTDTKSRRKATAYSYVSKVGGTIEIHHSWAQCEKRVMGVRSAKYKKAVNAEDEEKIVAEFRA